MAQSLASGRHRMQVVCLIKAVVDDTTELPRQYRTTSFSDVYTKMTKYINNHSEHGDDMKGLPCSQPSNVDPIDAIALARRRSSTTIDCPRQSPSTRTSRGDSTSPSHEIKVQASLVCEAAHQMAWGHSCEWTSSPIHYTSCQSG